MARGKKFTADQIIPKLREAELVIYQGGTTATAHVDGTSGVPFTHLSARRVI